MCHVKHNKDENLKVCRNNHKRIKS